MKNSILHGLLSLAVLTLAGCGGGGHRGGQPPGGGTPDPVTFTVSVAVTGLTGELLLQNNAADDLGVKADGTLAFNKRLASNSTYEVTIKTLPANQRCDLAPNAKGTIGTSNVTVGVTCTTNPVNTHTLSVNVQGLSSGTLELLNNLDDKLTVTANGIASFTPLAPNSDYAITVKTQPLGQRCDVGANGTGIITDSDITVAVTCSPEVSHLVSVNVTGLTAPVVLQNNGGDDLTVPANGVLAFSQRVPVGGSYAVTVKTPPAGETCQIPNASGTIADSDVAVAVNCSPNAPGTHSLSISVSGLSGSNSVVVQNNGGANVTLTGTSSNFTFGTFASGTAFAVNVVTQPAAPLADCAFGGNASAVTGVIGNSDVVLLLSCTALPVVTTLKADVSPFQAHIVTVTWPVSTTPPVTYNLYVSTNVNCDFRLCGEKLSGAQPGQVSVFNGQPLKNGQLYFFQLESDFTSSGSHTAKLLSNKAAARPNAVAFNNTVQAMTAGPDETVYLGGIFSRAGVASGSLVALDRASGNLAPVQVPMVAGVVNAIVADGSGGWYLGGEFTHVGNVVRHGLAHIRSDGGVDSAFDHGVDGRVLALARVDNTLYVGGQFNSIAPAPTGAATRNVAAINLSNGSLVSWSPNPNAAVHAIARLGGAVYIGGEFTDLHARFSGFDVDGSGLPVSATPTPINFNVNGIVEALTARDATLYVGGSFTSIGGRTQSGVARLDLDGGTPRLSNDFRPDPTNSAFSLSVKAIVVSDNASLVWIGGGFDELQGATRRESRTNLAALAASTGMVTPWQPNPDGPVTALAAQGNTIYAGGGFNTAGAGTSRAIRRGLAAIDLSNGSALELNPDVRQANGDIRVVQSLAIAGDTLYMGGGFTHLGGIDRRFLAAVDKFGNLTGWSPVANAEVRALLFHNNAALGPVIYAGGLFSTINGRSHSRLVALNTAGVDDTRFDGRVNGDVVNAIAVLDSAGLYVGGKFDSIGNPAVASPNVAKLFLNDGTINNLNGGFTPNPNDAVNALVATHDLNLGLDVVYLGGAFSDARGATRLAKVDGDSGLPIRTAGQLQFRGVDGNVNVLAMEDDGTSIYVGGEFNNVLQTAGQIARPGGLAQISAAGGTVTPFNPAPNTGTINGRPQALATLDAFTVMAGGAFTAIGGAPIANFAVLDHLFTTGSAIGRFAFPTGPVSALAVSGNRIYIGGRFSGFNAPVNASSDPGVRANFAALDANTGALVP